MGVTLTIDLLAKFNKAADGMNEFVDKAEKQVDKLSNKFDGLGTIAKAAVAFFAVDKVVDGLVSITNEAAESERNLNRLRGALRAAGDYSEQNVEAFENYAEEISKVTKYDDDLILSQFAVAKQFGATNQESVKLVQAAADLAAATGKDLPEAAELLGRSLDGSAGKLNELIPEIRSLTAEQLANGAAVDLIAKKYGGFAQSELNTFDGAVAKAGISVGDLQKAFGKVIIENDAVVKTVNTFTLSMQKLQQAVEDNKDGLGKLVTNGMFLFARGLELAVGGVQLFYETLALLGDEIANTYRRIAAIPSGVFNWLTNASHLNLALRENLNRAEKTANEATQSTSRGFVRIRLAADSLAESIKAIENNQRAVTEETEKTNSAFDDQKVKAERVSKELIDAYNQIKEESSSIATSELDKINKEYSKRIEKLYKFLSIRKDKEAEVLSVIAALTDKHNADVHALRMKQIEEERAAAEEFFKKHQENLKSLTENPLGSMFNDSSNLLGLTTAVQESVARGLGAVGLVLQGKQGATKLLSGVAEGLGQMFLGVPGIGSLFETLAQGPDKVKEMVREFAKAVPDIIEAVIEAIPVVIEELANALPEIAERLADKLPLIIERLAEKADDIVLALTLAMPKASIAFIRKLLEGAPQFIGRMLDGATQFVDKILQGAFDFIGEIINGAGRFIEELISKITDINPFKGGSGGLLGGSVIPGILKAGSANDSLTIPGSSSKSTSTATIARKSDQSSGLSRPIIVQVQIDKRTLAETILDLNKMGYRLA